MYVLKNEERLKELGFKESVRSYVRKQRLSDNYEFLEISTSDLIVRKYKCDEGHLIGTFATHGDVKDLLENEIVIWKVEGNNEK